MQEAINLYVELTREAVPFAIAFSFGNLIVATFIRMAFGGKVEF